MGIANELSSDVAAAVLSHKAGQAQVERKDLIEIVRNFYSALRPLIAEERRQRLMPISAPLESLSSDSKAVAGSH
jgi:hypothetical protein